MTRGPHRPYVPKQLPQDRVEFDSETAVFYGRITPGVHRHFQLLVNKARRCHSSKLSLDFSNVTNAYPNSMVPLIADVQSFISLKVPVSILLPRDKNMCELFRKANWAHLLAPDRHKPAANADYWHLATKQFRNIDEQQQVVNDFIDVTIRSLEIKRSDLAGLEWSITEVTDNVINHAESPAGGFIQLTSYPENQRIAFCVADCGKGILRSLKEGYPNLRTDNEAIATSVKMGATRNQKFGQGNGLSGSLKIAMKSEGLFAITSGRGYMRWSVDNNVANTYNYNKAYRGTFVDVQIPLGTGIDLSTIFEGHPSGDRKFTAIDTIENKYLSDDLQTLMLRMSEEKIGFGTRQAGAQMRTKIKNLMAAEPNCPVVIDWDGVELIASSYADEFLGKLYVEIGPKPFGNRVLLQNMSDNICKLLDMAITQRIQQQKINDDSS